MSFDAQHGHGHVSLFWKNLQIQNDSILKWFNGLEINYRENLSQHHTQFLLCTVLKQKFDSHFDNCFGVFCVMLYAIRRNRNLIATKTKIEVVFTKNLQNLHHHQTIRWNNIWTMLETKNTHQKEKHLHCIGEYFAFTKVNNIWLWMNFRSAAIDRKTFVCKNETNLCASKLIMFQLTEGRCEKDSSSKGVY